MYLYQQPLTELKDSLIESHSPCCHLIIDTLLALSLALKDNTLSCALIRQKIEMITELCMPDIWFIIYVV